MISEVKRSLLPVLVMAMTGATASHAQTITAGTGVNFERYSFAEPDAAGVQSITLMTVPFGVSLRPVSWANLNVAGAYASGSAVSADGTENSVDGLTDTSIQLSIPVARDRFTIAAAVILPTGKSTYTTAEAQVAGLIASDLFPFAITNWGGGGAFDLSGAVAAPLGAINLGVRVGYQVSNEFDLLDEGDFLYRPGNQMYGRVAADGTVGSGGRLAAEVSIYRYDEDQANSRNLYQAGDRLQAMLSYTFAAGQRGSAALYGGVLQRENGVYFDLNGAEADETASQTLLMFGGGLRRPMGSMMFVPAVDVRVLSKSDGVSQGYVAGLGATLELPMGGATLLPHAKFRLGNLLVREGSETGVTGFEVGAGLRFGGAQR